MENSTRNKTYRGLANRNADLKSEVKKTDSSIVKYLKRKSIVGFQGHSIYEVGRYFLRSLFREQLTIRASSLSFNFFLSLFPILIFLLTMVGYLPVKGLKSSLIKEISRLLPEASSKALSETILELLSHPSSGLLSLGLLLALYFASNAYHTMISSFNRSLPQRKKRNWIQNRLKAIFLTLLVTGLMIITLFILTQFYQANTYMHRHHWESRHFLKYLLMLVEYVIIIGFVLVSISSMYHFGPSNKVKWRFFSAGSILASVLSVLSTLLFSLYVNNFNSYNKVYGSIGAIIALMILIYINTLVVIVGFDLNASIDKAALRAAELNAEKKQSKKSPDKPSRKI